MSYLIIKYFHILSMVVLFGTGFGSAFYKWMADRSGNLSHIAVCNRHVVIADWVFTSPSIVFQLVSGLVLLHVLNISLLTPWVVTALILYVVVGLLWLPVVYLQIHMQKIAEHALKQGVCLPQQYHRYQKIWFYLGVLAFLLMLLIVVLMVFKTHVYEGLL